MSISASAVSGMTLCLYPASRRVGFDVVRSVARMNPAAVPVRRTTSSGPTCSWSTPRSVESSPSSWVVVSVSRMGQSLRPIATTASASRVIAFSRISREPCAARPRAISLIQTSDFSPVCSR